MDYFRTQYYEHNRRLYTFIGLWPYDEPSKRSRRIYMTSTAMILLLVIQMYQCFLLEMKLKSIGDLLQTFLPTICFVSCYCNLVYNSDTMKTILERMKHDWEELSNEEELVTMQKYFNQSKLCCFAIMYLFYLYAGFVIFPSLWGVSLYAFGVRNDTQLILPLRIEYCLRNKLRYFTMLPLQCISTIILYTEGIAYHSIFVSYSQHACALFSVLALKIDRPFKNGNCNFDSTRSYVKRNEEFNWIVSIIKYYNSCVEFVNLVRKAFGGVYLLQVILSLFFISVDFIYIFQIIDLLLTVSESLHKCIYMSANIFIIYASYAIGQRVIDHSSNIYAKCCQVPFYVLSVKTQKILSMFIMRSSKPCTYSMNGSIVASYDVFGKLANMSYTYALMCYHMH